MTNNRFRLLRLFIVLLGILSTITPLTHAQGETRLSCDSTETATLIENDVDFWQIDASTIPDDANALQIVVESLTDGIRPQLILRNPVGGTADSSDTFSPIATVVAENVTRTGEYELVITPPDDPDFAVGEYDVRVLCLSQREDQAPFMGFLHRRSWHTNEIVGFDVYVKLWFLYNRAGLFRAQPIDAATGELIPAASDTAQRDADGNLVAWQYIPPVDVDMLGHWQYEHLAVRFNRALLNK